MPEHKFNLVPDEITVRDGHLLIQLGRMHDGWYARVESDIEGKIFEGPITELSELLVGNPILDALDLGEIASE
jgi:hypothetical protein